MNLSTEQVAILRALAADDDIAFSMDDLLGTGLSELCIKKALRELIASGVVQPLFFLTKYGIELMKNEEVA
jgi:hypothetical protein